MAREKKSILDEEDDRIKFLEGLVNAVYREKIVVSEKGERVPKLTTPELLDLVAIEDKIMRMKRRRFGFPDKWK